MSEDLKLKASEKIESLIYRNVTVSIVIPLIISMILAIDLSERLGLELLSDESGINAILNYFLAWLFCACLTMLMSMQN
tara:strand:- start:40930 stop:41166 length:237 start_codon:yes stop_codon:yes gene_type:complete